MTDAHGRDHVSRWRSWPWTTTAGSWACGSTTYAAMGAYLSTFAPAVPTYLYGTLLSGQYDIPAIHVRTSIGHFTNTCSGGRLPWRRSARGDFSRRAPAGSRRPISWPSIRPRSASLNFVAGRRSSPTQTQVALEYDSGNYEPALDLALEHDRLRRSSGPSSSGAGEAGGKLLGIGLLELHRGLRSRTVRGGRQPLGAQAGLWESAKVRVHPTGSVTVYTGSSSHGQGHHTTFSQIVADRLGCRRRAGRGGTTATPRPGAVRHGHLRQPLRRGRRQRHRRERRQGDREGPRRSPPTCSRPRRTTSSSTDGSFQVKGVPAKGLRNGATWCSRPTWPTTFPEGLEPGLEARRSFYNPSNFVYPFGTHIAIVEIDPETGEVELVRYVAVDDCGNVINPMIVDGQVHGGLAQGIGQALWEEAVYDENGQLITGTMLDYALPQGPQARLFRDGSHGDALPPQSAGRQRHRRGGHHRLTGGGDQRGGRRPLALMASSHLDMPLTPEKVWRAIHHNGNGNGGPDVSRDLSSTSGRRASSTP